MLLNVVNTKRPMSQMRKLETKEAIFRARKRILKYLVLSYLKQEGYSQAADTFAAEAVITEEYQLCDNIDLDIILQDYCSYYLARFDKQPQFCRRRADYTPAERPARNPRPVARKAAAPAPVPAAHHADLPAALAITQMVVDESTALESCPPGEERAPLTGFLAAVPGDRRELAELLYRDIVRAADLSWHDVKGLGEAKSLLMEAVVYPVKFPEVFTGLLEPWRGVLLHGPPGTGKTMLARAVASESRCTFFNVACSTLVNKWRGESEKIVKLLFEMASHYSPSIIFIDEVETLASERAAAGEHEASRRLKTQLLTEMDGVGTRRGIVFVLANSNMPWEIDPAMLRRLEKRISIPLPDLKTRVELFEQYLNSKTIELYPKVDLRELAAKTEGYSGSDIKLVCKEALMASVRKILPNMVARSTNVARRERLDLSDLLTAIEKTKPVSKDLAKRHDDWQNRMGCS